MSEIPLEELLVALQNAIKAKTGDEVAIETQSEPDAAQRVSDDMDAGFKGVKLYPYDRGPVNALARHGGTFITQAELRQSLDPIQRIRKTAGDEMEIAVDLSSRWNLTCGLQIAHSLEPYGIMYLEDVMLPDNLEAYATLTMCRALYALEYGDIVSKPAAARWAIDSSRDSSWYDARGASPPTCTARRPPASTHRSKTRPPATSSPVPNWPAWSAAQVCS